jgi:hypothetical protein
MSILDFNETPSRGKATSRKSLKLVLGIGVISGAFALSSTLAASINLNSGDPVEFGQGIAQITECSNGQSLIVTPLSSFTNAAGAGSFKFTAVTVSNIPESCRGVDFVISAYNTSGDALAIFNTDSTVATIWNDAGTFKPGVGSLDGASISSDTGAFTFTFTSPVALATSVSRVTLQSTAHTPFNCARDLVCAPGDIGPGGGYITFVSSTPFNCGPTATATCRHLEIAPYGWNGSGSEIARWATDENVSYSGVSGTGGMVLDFNDISLGSIGRGYLNTLAIIATEDAPENATTIARAYRGGGLSDWYLPNAAEVNILCQWTNGNEVIAAGRSCIGGSANQERWGAQFGGIVDGNGLNAMYRTSSENYFQLSHIVSISTGEDYDNGYGKRARLLMRPVRAF